MAFDYEYSPSRDRGSCSTIIVGKDASATGYVLVAHNEDDYDCVIQVHKVPRIRHKPGETHPLCGCQGCDSPGGGDLCLSVVGLPL